MNISDSEKDELVEIMMKASGSAMDIEAAFDKMDPNSVADFLKFKKFIISQAEGEEENLREERDLNQGHQPVHMTEKSMKNDQSGYSVPQSDAKAPVVSNHQPYHEQDSMEKLNHQINQRNNGPSWHDLHAGTINPSPAAKEVGQHQPFTVPLDHIQAPNQQKNHKPETVAHQDLAHAMNWHDFDAKSH
jgi:hypothetical protein